MIRWIADYVLQNITYMLLCGYTPFRADDMKKVIRQTESWQKDEDRGGGPLTDCRAEFEFAIPTRPPKSDNERP